MTTTAMLARAAWRPLPLRTPARIATLQLKRSMAAVAAAETTARDNGYHGHQHLMGAGTPTREEFWRRVPVYENVSTREFLSYRWSVRNTVQGKEKLLAFLNSVVPDEIPFDKEGTKTQTKEDFLLDFVDGVNAAAMSVRITPYVLSRINWRNPRNDPIFRQFVPLKSVILPDHPKLTLDSLHETDDSPVNGLVHRYPDKALFLALSVCPTYCTYCTRSYAVGADTDSVSKQSVKPTRKRWDEVFAYIDSHPQIQDIVISGGDSYLLQPEHIQMIGERLIGIPHIRRFRFATKGLAVAPTRLLDPEDGWAASIIDISQKARWAGKSMAIHTHFNHPNEISWVTEVAAQRLFEAGVIVRNQSVLLKDINDNFKTMSTLIRSLADNNISPYYVYLCDMVKMNEHARTTLQTMLDLEAQIRGSIAGFAMPQFVVDLPGGGGKRISSTYESYDRKTGVSKYVAPAVTSSGHADGAKPDVFEYYDPIQPAQ